MRPALLRREDDEERIHVAREIRRPLGANHEQNIPVLAERYGNLDREGVLIRHAVDLPRRRGLYPGSAEKEPKRRTYSPPSAYPVVRGSPRKYGKKGLSAMKIVVVHSPRFLRPLLRRLFGIGKA